MNQREVYGISVVAAIALLENELLVDIHKKLI